MRAWRVVPPALAAVIGACASGSGGGATSTGAVATSAAATMAASTPRLPAPVPVRLQSRETLRIAIDSMLANPQFRNAHFGVLVVDPKRGDTLYSREAGKLFMPASNMKIVTGATSLAQLGPDFSFRTEFGYTGRIVRDTLQGALVVTGRGDPTISDHMRGNAMLPLYDVADSLKAHGVKAINGSVRSGVDVFPDSTIGFGWSWDDLGEDYGAGVDALYLNEGFGLAIANGRPGRLPDSIITLPANEYPLVDIAPASRAGDPDTFDLRLENNPRRPGFVVRGKLTGVSDTLIYVYHNQQEAYFVALRQALAARGIAIANSPRYMLPGGKANDSLHPTVLFTTHSPPLRQILTALEKPSQNQIAEILYKTLGLERTGTGSADSGRAVVERQLIAWGAAPDGFVIRDGSGLSRYDYVSPETLVRVLDKIRADTAFRVFYDALPIAGVDGSLRRRMRGTAAEGHIHAKTGSIANARSLSGYAITPDADTLIFSLLANNWTTNQSAVDSVHDRIAVLLASMSLRGAEH